MRSDKKRVSFYEYPEFYFIKHRTLKQASCTERSVIEQKHLTGCKRRVTGHFAPNFRVIWRSLDVIFLVL